MMKAKKPKKRVKLDAKFKKGILLNYMIYI
jgi:hypothetical protein